MRGGWTFVLGVLASALVVTAPTGAAAAGTAPTVDRYRMVDLGTLGGATSQAYAMNDRHQVVGRSDTADGAVHPFLWDRGRMVDLGLLGGFQGTPSAINDRGQIVGSSDVPDGGQHAVLWQDGRILDLGTLGGAISAASDINDRGQVVGVSLTATDGWHAFLWQNGGMTDLGAFDARGVNNRTQVIGAMGRAYEGEDVFPVRWARGQLTVLSTGPGSAGGINDAGMITVNTTRDDGTERASVWYRGRLTALPTLGGNTGAGSINDQGQILGRSTSADGTTASNVLWTRMVLTDLASLGVHPDAFLTALDNHGDIAGSHNSHAVLYRK
jgi:probable HAF family extracellular repeat protein